MNKHSTHNEGSQNSPVSAVGATRSDSTSSASMGRRTAATLPAAAERHSVCCQPGGAGRVLSTGRRGGNVRPVWAGATVLGGWVSQTAALMMRRARHLAGTAPQ
eukprot:SAG25_NODE_337_length_9543_cov_4.171961_3_plen_104_part_00